MFKIRFNTSNAGLSAGTLEAKNGRSQNKSRSFLMPLLGRNVGICLVLSLFPACMSFVDSDFSVYEPQMPSNPRPDAILGMWHHKNQGGMISASHSIFFKADGTFYFHGGNGNPNAAYNATGTWKYEGAGWWTGHTSDANKNIPRHFRCDGKRLLQYTDPDGGFTVWRLVYVRTE